MNVFSCYYHYVSLFIKVYLFLIHILNECIFFVIIVFKFHNLFNDNSYNHSMDLKINTVFSLTTASCHCWIL